jgi:chromate transport protein ChrA
MGTVSRLWFALAGFLAVAGLVYLFTSHEKAGGPLLLVAGSTFAYLALVARAEVRRSGADANKEEAEAEEPNVAPTIWPFGFSIAAVLIALGFIVNRWIMVPAALAFAAAAAGWLRDITRSHSHS